MTFGLSAAAIGGIAAGAGAIGGAIISGNAAEDAAQTQAGAAGAATAAQERMFNKQLELQQPWNQGGRAGLNALLQYAGLPVPASVSAAPAPEFDAQAYYDAYLKPAPGQQADRYYNSPERALEHYNDWGRGEGRQVFYKPQPAAPAGVSASIDPSLVGSILKPFSATQFTADPGYQFRLEQGEKGLTRAAQAGGGRSLTSGAYLKDAMKFNSGLASQEYGNAESRYNTGQTNIWNRLAGLAGIGQQATNQSTNAAGAFGQQVGSNIIGAGNATAAGQVGSANAWNQAIGQGISLYNQNAMLNRVYPQGGGGVTPPNPYYGTPTVPVMDWYQ